MTKKLLQLTCILLAIVMISACGSGGGGTTTTTASNDSVQPKGFVSLPAGITLSRSSSRIVDSNGLIKTPAITVSVYAIDDSGVQSGGTIDTVVSDYRGYYVLDVPEATGLSKNLIVSVGTGVDRMRAFGISDYSTDVNPISELIVSEILSSTYTLSGFTDSELLLIRTYIDKAAETFQFVSYASVSAAVTALDTGQVATNLDELITQMGSGTYVQHTCGNKILETEEECDDGNTVSNDGCSSTCRDE